MCWVYLLKNKFEAFQKFKKIYVRIEKTANTRIGTLHSNKKGSVLQMNSKPIFANMESNIKLLFLTTHNKMA